MTCINYQHEFITKLARILRDRPDDAQQQLDHLTAINDGWMQGIEERTANIAMIEAIYEALEVLHAALW